MTAEESIEGQFDDENGLDEGNAASVRKARLEAREHELTVTVPMALSTTMMLSQSNTSGIRLHNT